MSPRKKSKTARTRYMMVDFTPEEKKFIIEFCREQKITISSFLAEAAMGEVDRASEGGSPEEKITIVLTVPAEQGAKMRMFARRRGQSLDEFVSEEIMPTVEKGRIVFRESVQPLRYYLSPQQHRRLKQFLKSKNLSARLYVAYLAMREIERRKKKKK
jgi:hypothetical protein